MNYAHNVIYAFGTELPSARMRNSVRTGNVISDNFPREFCASILELGSFFFSFYIPTRKVNAIPFALVETTTSGPKECS